MTEAPILPAFRTPTGGVRAWCIYCQHWHYHGGEGHVVAHCDTPTPTPYDATGYTLVLADEVTDARRPA